MKKSHLLISGFLMAIAIVLFITFAVWAPCNYAMIVPSIFATISLSNLVIAKISSKNEVKKLATNN